MSSEDRHWRGRVASPLKGTPPEKPKTIRRTQRAKYGETLRETLARPGMKPYAAAAEAAVMDGRLKRPGLLTFAAWRDWRKEQGLQGLATDQEFQRYSDGDKSVGRLDGLARAIAVITPMSPDLAAIERVRSARRRVEKPPRGYHRRKPKISVPESALPPSWRVHLDAMRAGEPGPDGHRPPAPPIIQTITHLLRRFVYVCEQAGLSVEFAKPQFKAFIEAMKERKNSHRTIVTHLKLIRVFLVYSQISPDLEKDVKRQALFEARKHRGTKKKKEKFLAKTGLSLIDVANGACATLDKLERALSGEGPPLGTRDRYVVANEAALLGFVLTFAPRLADIHELIIEKTAMRDETAWWFDFESHKTGVSFWTPADKRLTVFIDQAILHGLDESFFAQAYERRLGTPLFVTGALNQPASYQWASRLFARRFGIGIHIVRDLLQKWAASDGLGLEEVMVLCGHRSPESAQHYVSQEARLDRIRRMQEKLVRRGRSQA